MFLLNSGPWLYSVCSAWDQQGRWKIILTGQLTILHKYYKQEWQLRIDFHSPSRRKDVLWGSLQLPGTLLQWAVLSEGLPGLHSGQWPPRGTSRAWPAPHLRRAWSYFQLLQRAYTICLKTWLLHMRFKLTWCPSFLFIIIIFPPILFCTVFVGQLQRYEVRQMLWIALGAARVPGLIKIKEREQNTIPSSNPLL